MIGRVVDRALNRRVGPPPGPTSGAGAALHARIPVVDLLVGTPLFRRTLLTPVRHGLVDLPRLEAGGVRLVGFGFATRFPDLRGTLSTPHFASLGLPLDALRSDMRILRALVARVDAWSSASGGRFVVVREQADLDAVLAPGGPAGAFLAVQGAHVLGGRLDRIDDLQRLGIRMLSLVHVMDNEAGGSGTGRRGDGLTAWGAQLIGALERVGIVVDLAHASSATIRDAVPLLTQPFVLSHTGFVERAGGASRWRRYSAASRNVSTADARLVAAAGGVVGVVSAADLLGGRSVLDLVGTIRYAVDELGPAAVALGSDLDGALPAVLDAAGFPAVTDGLLAAGMPESQVEAVMGRNALGVLAHALVPHGASAVASS